MNEWLSVAIAIFATYRLASLVASEEGPYLPFLYKDANQTGIFEWIRHKAGAYNYEYTYDERGNQRVEITTNLGRGISCPLCVGGYLAFVIAVSLAVDNVVINFFLVWLAVWGVQVFLENLTSDDAIKDAIQDVAESVEDK